MKKYSRPMVMESSGANRIIPAALAGMIAGLSVGKALAAGAALAVGKSLLSGGKDDIEGRIPALEPCIL
ncbi:MAG: hypothetical protein IJ576_03765 [Synergistaceae bacterium]|nr:hypothetical protein [Synergistaceae bacterium]MBR1604135.1 hypothetical protein [Synergistaceae bacterium]